MENKVHGPDGFKAQFLKSLNEDIVKAIQSFFRSGKFLGEVNAIIISLVPMIPNPSKIGGFQRNSLYVYHHYFGQQIETLLEIVKSYHKSKVSLDAF